MKFLTLAKQTIKRKLPGFFRILKVAKRIVFNVLIQGQVKTLKKKIAKQWQGDPEAAEIISFLESNSVEMIPYFYTLEVKDKEVPISKDPETGLHFVSIKGNNIYYPLAMDKETIADSVRVSIMEQDERSPHKYLPNKTMDVSGDIAILCGASDGIYALEIMNKFNKIYLFEANPDWIAPLKKTLHNYLDKVEVVPYFISDQNGPGSITLDTFLENKKGTVNYLQADIEGDELKMLLGGMRLLEQSNNLALSVCCYHTLGQEKELTDCLSGCGYKVSPSKGYLLLWMQYPLRSPYLRRGVLYATKFNSATALRNP
jgi:hypothetical protein